MSVRDAGVALDLPCRVLVVREGSEIQRIRQATDMSFLAMDHDGYKPWGVPVPASAHWVTDHAAEAARKLWDAEAVPGRVVGAYGDTLVVTAGPSIYLLPTDCVELAER